jgi:hypothetical protein
MSLLLAYAIIHLEGNFYPREICLLFHSVQGPVRLACIGGMVDGLVQLSIWAGDPRPCHHCHSRVTKSFSNCFAVLNKASTTLS